MNINKLILLIVLFSIAIIIFAIFVILNDFVINKISNKIKNKKNYLTYSIFIQLIRCAFVFGALFFIFIIPQLNWIEKNSFLINIFYIPIIIIIGTIFNTWLSMIISLMISIAIIIDYGVISATQYDFFINTMFQLLSLFLAVGIMIVSGIFRKKHSKLSNFTASIIFTISIIILSIIFFYSNVNYMVLMIIQTCIIWVLYLIMYELTNLYKQFFKKIQSISDTKIYENKYFFNANLAKHEIYTRIKNENIEYGVVILFDLINFNSLHPIWGNSGAKFIQKQFLNEMANSFQSLNPILFMNDKNEYTCFIKLKNFNLTNLKEIYTGNNKQTRTSIDPIKSIQNVMLNIPRYINYKNNSKKIIAGAYGAIYGIHSSDINQLISLCYKTKQKSYASKRTNILNIYEPSKILIGKNIKDINHHNDYFQPNNFQISLKLETNILGNDYQCFVPQVSYVNRLLFGLDNIKSFTQSKGIYDNTIRMIAMQSLKKYNNQISKSKQRDIPIILDYPINFIVNDNFNLGDFKNKLQTLNIEASKLILKLDLNNLNTNIDELHNLINLKKIGLKFIFSNVTLNNMNVLEKIIPDYLSFKKDELNSNQTIEIQEIKNVLKSMNIKMLN